MKKTRMAVGTWIQEHRAEIDAEVERQCPNLGRLTDRDRRLWVLNVEGLYRWARADGALI